MATKRHVVGVQAPLSRKELARRDKEILDGILESEEESHGDRMPRPTVPKKGRVRPESLRGLLQVRTPHHRASSRVLGTAYPFLTATGETLRGPYIGEDMLARSPFCFDPWMAYVADVIRSHSVAIIGVKGSGKSMLAKSWAAGLIVMGRKVAVPHDPNGEWAKIAPYVGGKSITIGRGSGARINLLDPGVRDANLNDAEWAEDVLSFRRGVLKATITQLRGLTALAPVEHTVIDLLLREISHRDVVTLPAVLEALRTMPTWFREEDPEVLDAARTIAHTIRLTVEGELAGMFDGPSTVAFDPSAPLMAVDTSAMKNAAPEAKALVRLATSNWIRRATTGSHRVPRVIVHEEAAIELLNDVTAGGSAGLTSKVADEKVARHDGVSNWYLLHRIADLDALGDRNSAVHSQALGLLADCDTRVTYAQHEGELERSQQVLGWNDTMRRMVKKLDKGEGLWQIGPDRIVKVKNRMTSYQERVFRTDQVGGERA